MLHTLLMSLVGSASLFLPLRIDLGMDTRRSDTANPRWDEWQVPDGSVAHRRFGSLEITLRAADGQQIRGQWHKPGLATGAKLATDGVSVSSEQSDADA